MPSPARVFGANLARERQRQAHTMRSLARRAGMHASEISRLERGQRDPRLWTMVRLAHALDVPLIDLLIGVHPPTTGPTARPGRVADRIWL